MKNPLVRFAVRWAVSAAGIWLATVVLGSDRITYGGHIEAIALASLLLAIINTFIKPILVLFSLPALLFSLGLFMVVINGFTLWLVSKLYEPLKLGGFGAAMVAGIIIGLLNYIVTTVLEEKDE